MARLRRKLTGRSRGEDSAPVEAELGTDLTDDPTEPVDPAEAAYGDAEPGDGETAPEPGRSEDDVPEGGVAADDVPEDETPQDDVSEDEVHEESDDLPIDENPVVEPPRRGVRGSIVLSLAQAAHLKQAVVAALVVGGVAALDGRSAREVGVVCVTVLVGQILLGWHNDLTDRARDRRQDVPNKPLADGRLEPGTVWYAIVVAVLILLPLSITTGITAGCLYLMSVAIGMLGNVVARRGVLSWWSWAVSFALIPYYLSYGGWGGKAVGVAPEPAIVVLAALLGIGVHFMRSVWGLVADHEEGWTYLPLKLALKIGATKLLAVSTAYTVVIVVILAIVGANVGLSR